MPIHHAINKYGVNNFTFEVLMECLPESIDFFEKAFIQGYSSSHVLYNIQTGGQGGWGHIDNRGSKRSEESRKKMSDAARLRPKRISTDETKAKQSTSLKGHKVSEETRKKISDALRRRTS